MPAVCAEGHSRCMDNDGASARCMSGTGSQTFAVQTDRAAMNALHDRGRTPDDFITHFTH